VSPLVASSSAPPLQARARYQPTSHFGVAGCCENYCGTLVPFATKATYKDSHGHGKSYVSFNLAASPWCGIPVARVLTGDLVGLLDRDKLSELNPNSRSMRLRIEVGDPFPIRPSHELTYDSGRATKNLNPRSA
jgi:hypothetical protein